MRRSLSRTARMALYVGLALGAVPATAQPDSDANAARNPGAHRFGGLRGPYFQTPGEGFNGIGGPRQGRRPVFGTGWRYGGPRFGGVPVGVGGMAGLFIAAGAAAAANGAGAEPATPAPPRLRRAPERAHPRPAPIVHAPPPPPPAPARTIVRAPRPPRPPAPSLAANAHPPPPGETRYRPGEVLVATAPGLPPDAVNGILGRHRLVEADAATIGLTGQSLRLWRFPPSRPVPQVVRDLGAETALASIQPNYVYAPQDGAAGASAPGVDQYWLAKLKVDKSLDLSSVEPVRVAVIDTAIDEAHPDLVGSIEAEFDAIGGKEPAHTREHGTSMAGAIAAHGLLKGVAPTVRILSARALDRDDRGFELGSTQSVMKAVQWAFDHGARIVNMSFAGPVEDPALRSELAAAAAKGLVLIGAAGNDGPKSPPRYPGADDNVVAVTATDANDAVYALANAGSYVAVAAPGVDVLLTAPNGGYAMETGTSVSAALVSGVAALLIERRPDARPPDVRAWLMKTAEPLASAANRTQAGAGLVDARRATEAAARSGGSTAVGSKLPGS